MRRQVQQKAADGVSGSDKHTLTAARHLDSHAGRGPKGIKYPAPWALDPGAVHQADFVGPRYVGGVRFYSLNAVDVASARAAAEPVFSRATEHVIPGLWSIWKRLGIPKALQLDNELVFFGNRRYPRATGQVMRLCLEAGVEMVFIPIREPRQRRLLRRWGRQRRQAW